MAIDGIKLVTDIDIVRLVKCSSRLKQGSWENVGQWCAMHRMDWFRYSRYTYIFINIGYLKRVLQLVATTPWSLYSSRPSFGSRIVTRSILFVFIERGTERPFELNFLRRLCQISTLCRRISAENFRTVRLSVPRETSKVLTRSGAILIGRVRTPLRQVALNNNNNHLNRCRLLMGERHATFVGCESPVKGLWM